MNDNRKPPTTLHDLHDTSLLSVQVDWTTGTARLAIRWGPGPGGICALVCDDATQIEASRAAPWGPSQSINTASWVYGGSDENSGGGMVKIALQSGDVVRVTCGRYAVAAD